MDPTKLRVLIHLTLLGLLVVAGFAFVGQVFDIEKLKVQPQFGSTNSHNYLLVASGADGFACTATNGQVTTGTDGSVQLAATDGSFYTCNPIASRTFYLSSASFNSTPIPSIGLNNVTIGAGTSALNLVVYTEADDDDDDPSDPFKHTDTGIQRALVGTSDSDMVLTFGTPLTYVIKEKSHVNSAVAGFSITALLLATAAFIYLLVVELRTAPETYATV